MAKLKEDHQHINQDKVEPALKGQELDSVDQVHHINLEDIKELLVQDTKVLLALDLAQDQVLPIKELDINQEQVFLQAFHQDSHQVFKEQEPQVQAQAQAQHIDQAPDMVQQSNKAGNQDKLGKLVNKGNQDKVAKADKVAHQLKAVLLDMEDRTILHTEELEATIDTHLLIRLNHFYLNLFFSTSLF